MIKVMKRLCFPIMFGLIFLAAGGIGLICESWHNDLIISTGAFLTSFTAITGFAWKLYSTFT